MLLWAVPCSALKKLNEKKQVFNMYKTQKQKEEKVLTLTIYHIGKYKYTS